MENSKNKIILIGNGFDLAHGLKTRYSDFLEFLSNVTYEKGVKCGKSNYPQHKHYKTNNGKNDPWIALRLDLYEEHQLEVNPHTNKNSIYYKRLFDEKKNPASMKWADLETFYFNLLIENKGKSDHIKTINEEFAHLKVLLEEYLKNEVETKEVRHEELNNHPIMELLLNDTKNYDQVYFITFNYTSKVLEFYYKKLNNLIFSTPPIHIHGKLSNTENPIIFGYGDENSANYQELESALNDDLLVNFKTFQYLRTENYHTVLSLLECSDDIDVQIIGHSCGLCDKALLRKIFQHENVKSIEAVYHGNETNYFSKLYNISRIFDDNILMREKMIPLRKTSKI